MLWGRFWGHFGAPIILGSHNGLCLTCQTGSIPVQPLTDSSIGMWWLVCRVEQVWHAILKTVVTDTFKLLIEGPFTDHVHLLYVPRPKQLGGNKAPYPPPSPGLMPMMNNSMQYQCTYSHSSINNACFNYRYGIYKGCHSILYAVVSWHKVVSTWLWHKSSLYRNVCFCIFT